jgi:hypothetical protein
MVAVRFTALALAASLASVAFASPVAAPNNYNQVVEMIARGGGSSCDGSCVISTLSRCKQDLVPILSSCRADSTAGKSPQSCVKKMKSVIQVSVTSFRKATSGGSCSKEQASQAASHVHDIVTSSSDVLARFPKTAATRQIYSDVGIDIWISGLVSGVGDLISDVLSLITGLFTAESARSCAAVGLRLTISVCGLTSLVGNLLGGLDVAVAI